MSSELLKGGSISMPEIIRSLLARRASSTESVSVRENAKGEPQFEVNGVVQDGESLLDCALRVESVRAALRASLAADGPDATAAFTQRLTIEAHGA